MVGGCTFGPCPRPPICHRALNTRTPILDHARRCPINHGWVFDKIKPSTLIKIINMHLKGSTLIWDGEASCQIAWPWHENDAILLPVHATPMIMWLKPLKISFESNILSQHQRWPFLHHKRCLWIHFMCELPFVWPSHNFHSFCLKCDTAWPKQLINIPLFYSGRHSWVGSYHAQ